MIIALLLGIVVCIVCPLCVLTLGAILLCFLYPMTVALIPVAWVLTIFGRWSNQRSYKIDRWIEQKIDRWKEKRKVGKQALDESQNTD